MWLAQRNLNCVADLAAKINARAEINFDNEHALNPLACKDPRLAAHCLRRDNPLDFPLRAKTRKAQCEQMLSALPPRADIAQRSRHVRFVPILLKKSFLADEQNFSGPLMRSARGDVRDHIVLHKNDHGPSYRA